MFFKGGFCVRPFTCLLSRTAEIAGAPVSGIFLFFVSVSLAGWWGKVGSDSAALTHGDGHIQAHEVTYVIQVWKIWGFFKSCFNLMGVKCSEWWSKACRMRFDWLWDPKNEAQAVFTGLVFALSLWAVVCWKHPFHENTLSESLWAMLGGVMRDGEQRSWAHQPSTPQLVGGALKAGMSCIGCVLLTALSQALPQRAFPYRSPYCQNNA